MHGMDVYIAEPAGLTTGKAVLMIPEVNGAVPSLSLGPSARDRQ